MNVFKIFTLCSLILLLFMGASVGSQQGESGDKTLSPYFYVLSDDPDVDQLPLQSTSAVANISGVIADVRVTQVYKNEGKRPLEAIYVFPASTRAAVYGMKMTVGTRVITAQIRKREEARQEYEQAKQQGKSASLLEQQRPNVFQMNVANILPGDVITVELSYTELLVPTDGVYEFVYPTVVGPRYSNQPADTSPPSERWIQNPYLHQGESPHYAFDITVNLNAGMPVKEITSPSHKVKVSYDSPSIAAARLDQAEKYGGNRDYILQYRLDGGQIESGILLYEGEKKNFFLLMMQPPRRVTNAQIPKREYIFIVDVSGSMHGFPLDISKTLLKDLIGRLRPTDTFNVLLFAGGSTVLSEKSLPATQENIGKAIAVIDSQKGGGGTELLPALKRALALPKGEGYARTVVIATDGYVTVEEEAFDLIRKNLGNANMFPFGIGSSVNRHIIEGMARVGMGEPFVGTK
ncbi:MAG: VIT and VWA domain-containing protein [Thermodesulfovibrionales bacterium]|nr:VIT and VWA domain-containing protein [Thermodesulfovibrionales bacterium]